MSFAKGGGEADREETVKAYSSVAEKDTTERKAPQGLKYSQVKENKIMC